MREHDTGPVQGPDLSGQVMAALLPPQARFLAQDPRDLWVWWYAEAPVYRPQYEEWDFAEPEMDGAPGGRVCRLRRLARDWRTPTPVRPAAEGFDFEPVCAGVATPSRHCATCGSGGVLSASPGPEPEVRMWWPTSPAHDVAAFGAVATIAGLCLACRQLAKLDIHTLHCRACHEDLL